MYYKGGVGFRCHVEGTWKDCDTAGASSGASTSLDNLTAVAIKTSLLPETSGGVDLGSVDKRWGNLYLSGGINAPGVPINLNGPINLNADTTIASGKRLFLGGPVSGAAAPLVATVGAGSCTSVTVGGGGTDTRGSVTAYCPTANSTAVVNFNAGAYGGAPYCVISPVNGAAAASNAYIATVTKDAMTITVPLVTSGAIWNYICIQ